MFTISHPFVSVKADGVDATLVQPSNWNANHTVSFDGLDFVSNVITNGCFRLNQRGYVSAAALAAGKYGHDRWKAGASGGDYSFTQLASPTQVTIAANKSLIQVVEDKNVVGGTYILSWTGTATARVGLNSATPSGNFAVSPITIAGQTVGTVLSVEFTGANAAGGSTIATNAGTLGTVKCEKNSVATPFFPDEFGLLLLKCQRYFETSFPLGTAPADGVYNTGPMGAGCNGWIAFDADHIRSHTIQYKAAKRANPTVMGYHASGIGAGAANQWCYFQSGSWHDTTSMAAVTTTTEFGMQAGNTAAFTATQAYLLAGYWTAEAEL